jgi:two-component sensor histidine kinase
MADKDSPADASLTTDLASALQGDHFRQFLDHVPFAVAVSQLSPAEQIIYANPEFETLTGQPLADLEGKPWSALRGQGDDGPPLSAAITDDEDYIGVFSFDAGDDTITVDAWSNVIPGDDGEPSFRLISLATAIARRDSEMTDVQKRFREKDLQLRELQHRVANNLQLITALIRAEARNMGENASLDHFGRLAGRIEALGILYRALSDQGQPDTIDLGVYLSEVASAVMHAHAREGIQLDLRVDSWPVSINVAMPAGLLVNELLTNSLKHAFEGREGGTLSLRSLVNEAGFRLSIGDDGVGLPEGAEWPAKGRLSGMFVQSLRQNARARVDFQSTPGEGVSVTVIFARDDAA